MSLKSLKIKERLECIPGVHKSQILISTTTKLLLPGLCGTLPTIGKSVIFLISSYLSFLSSNDLNTDSILSILNQFGFLLDLPELVEMTLIFDQFRK